jgi:hypothetical protein
MIHLPDQYGMIIFILEDKMQKKTSLLFGVTMILLGLLALAGNLLIRAGGERMLLGFRSWPIFVVGAGLLFCLPPFIFSKSRGLSGLFIPGVPTLTTGILLFLASISGNWHIWAFLWPLEVISLAVGFILMSVFLKIPWLMIPASIIGLTGLVLQFCAATGGWSSWAVLWTVEPFAVGLPLLLIGLVKKIKGLKTAGIILISLAGLGFAAMSTILFSTHWVTRLVVPAVVLALGILLVVTAFLNRSPESPNP